MPPPGTKLQYFQPSPFNMGSGREMPADFSVNSREDNGSGVLSVDPNYYQKEKFE